MSVDFPQPSFSIQFRVHYHETDGQGRVHHGQYLNYFERGRVELLRSMGFSYREFEASGLFLVVSEMHLNYLGAAIFDDQLKLTTTVSEVRGVRIRHRYEIEKLPELTDSETSNPKKQEMNSERIVEGYSTIACVDRTGKVRPLPEYLRKLK